MLQWIAELVAKLIRALAAGWRRRAEKPQWRATEELLLRALDDQRKYAHNFELSGLSWGTAGQMRQLTASTINFVVGEIPRGADEVSVVVSGDPEGHPDDVLYLGARVGQSDTCLYLRDVIQRASASMTPGLVWAISRPCVAPHAVQDWRSVGSTLDLFKTSRT